jgi:hypothetical protein
MNLQTNFDLDIAAAKKKGIDKIEPRPKKAA